MSAAPPASVSGWAPPTPLITRNPRLQSVDRALQNVVASLEKEQELKRTLREAMDPLEDVARRATSILNDLHSAHNIDQRAVAGRAMSTIEQVKDLWEYVNKLIPPGEFHRYAWAISPTIRTLVQLTVYAWYIIYDSLASSASVALILDIKEESGDGVVLIADDYLQGVIGAINELPRLSINSVTAGNYLLPLRISNFVNDVFSAYSQLNLRNDQLRRKFDSLKYDVKRCEDVIYDLTLRGLISRTPRYAGVMPLPGGPQSPAHPGQPLPASHPQTPGHLQPGVRPASPGQALGFQPYPAGGPQATPPRYGAPGPRSNGSPQRPILPLPTPARRPSASLPSSIAQNTSPLSHSGVDLPPIKSQQGKVSAALGSVGGTSSDNTDAPAEKASRTADPEAVENEERPSQASPEETEGKEQKRENIGARQWSKP